MSIKRRQADVLFSQYIRQRDKFTCTRCYHYFPEGERGGLHNSHFYGRANESTRFDDENCCALCHGCHAYFTANPELHREWQLKRLGKDRFDRLRLRASLVHKKDDKMAMIVIKEQIKLLKE